MSKKTGIEWTDSTWNPIRGCSRVSAGCKNCYAEAVAARFSGPGQPYEGLAVYKDASPHWTGELRLIEKHLDDPLHWKTSAKIFVNSMSDLFHPAVTAEWLARIFDVMARAPQHTYQILTKRPERMLDILAGGGDIGLAETFQAMYGRVWPPENWWFGVSVEDQKTANERIPILARTPARVKFVSYEPALGPLDLAVAAGDVPSLAALDWIIAGGESGSHARPMCPRWARDVRDLCVALDIPFFFKQWGEWGPGGPILARQCAVSESGKIVDPPLVDRFPEWSESESWHLMYRTGKKSAGALLDGVEWKQFPPIATL